MIEFFTWTLEDTDDFRQFVLRHLHEVGNEPAIRARKFRLANRMVAGLSNGVAPEADKVVSQALDEIRGADDVSGLTATEAFGLLAVCASSIKKEEIPGLLKKVFQGKPAHFALRSVVEIVKQLGKEKLKGVAKELEETVLKCWNERAESERILATACLEICAVLQPDWAKDLTERWDAITHMQEAEKLPDDKLIDFAKKLP
jgi:hypothetical protein